MPYRPESYRSRNDVLQLDRRKKNGDKFSITCFSVRISPKFVCD